MKKFEKALDKLLDEEVKFLMPRADGKNGFDNLKSQKSGELLFFPRKKVSMHKLRSGLWEPKAWFIKERLPEKSTSLDLPTDITRQGLTSGLRSAIVKEGKNYFRLKGVAPKTYEAQRWAGIVPVSKVTSDIRGLCSLFEAYPEQVVALSLDYAKFDRLAMKPAFIEFFLPPSRKNISFNLAELVSPEASRIVVSETSSYQQYISNFLSLKNFYDRFHNRAVGFGGSFVSAFKVDGDTRVDEAFYELTKKKLTGEKRRERDELMRYLSFKSGAALASLNLLDFAWSQRHDATNSHLGNFVVNVTGGVVQVGLADLNATCHSDDFGGRGEFYEFIFKDLENFSYDFYADYTTSLPTSLPFREFPAYLRQSCLMAFGTGYVMKYASTKKYDKYDLSVLPPFFEGLKLVAPKKSVLGESEFRERIKYVTE